MANNPPGKANKNQNPEQNPNTGYQNDAAKALSEHEIKRLPLRKVRAGNTEYRGYYDENTLLLYFADENGELKRSATGGITTGQLKNPLPVLTPDVEKDEDNEDPAEELKKILSDKKNQALSNVNKKLSKKKEPKPEKEPKEKSGKGRKAIIILLIILIIGVLGFGGYIYLNSRGNSGIQIPISAPKEDEIMVIEVKNDIVPGGEIKEDNLKSAAIDSQTFNQISINGNNLYRWEQRDNIVGMYASEFISQGQYITTNLVARTYTPETNPWGINSDEFISVDVPIDINNYDRTKLLIGKKVNLTYEIDKKEDNSSETLPANMNGVQVMEMNKTVTTKSYSVQGATITNIISANDSNLFEVYSALIKIPEGNQEHYIKQQIKYNKEYISSITPSKIRVTFDKTYADALLKAVQNNETISVELTNDTDVSTQDKSDFYNKEQQLTELLNSLMK